MRKGLTIDELKSVYGRIARRYDREHRAITLGSDQRGRMILIQQAVREGNHVLDCGAGTGTTGMLASTVVGPRDM